MGTRIWQWCAIAFLATTSFGLAATVSYSTAPNLNVSIPDGTYNGTLGSMASVSLNIPDSATLFDVNVTIALDHTWIGDLVIKVQDPSGTVITLMSRPGVSEPADNGDSSVGNGDSSNLLATFAITFDQGQLPRLRTWEAHFQIHK